MSLPPYLLLTFCIEPLKLGLWVDKQCKPVYELASLGMGMKAMTEYWLYIVNREFLIRRAPRGELVREVH